MLRHIPVFVSVALLLGAASAKAGEINLLTHIGTPFPPGCIALALPEEPPSSHPDDSIVRTFDAPSILSDSLDARVRATIWRVGCPDENFSVVMVRLEDVSEDDPVLIPLVFAEAGQVEGRALRHEAQLIPRPAVGNIGASGNFREIPAEGVTYMLAVEPTSWVDGEATFWHEEYNGQFTLELFWGDYSIASGEVGEVFHVFPYDPEFDAQQFEQPVFHGRHTGNYRVNNHPRTGLMLQVAEITHPDDPPGSLAGANYIFAIFFTYTNDGEQLWITGNSGPETPGPVSELELEMFRPEGGMFFTSPTGSFSSDDVDMVPVGTLTLRVVDCNNLEGDFNFTEGGFGSGSLDFQRLIRIAGYDCNPWE